MQKKHREFAELLYELKGFVVLSGYPSKIYEELFEAKGWKRVDKEAAVLGGGKKTECLWLSPRCIEALGEDFAASDAARLNAVPLG